MLRLCHGLKRYSAALDFWFIRDSSYDKYQDKLITTLSRFYKILDNQIKHSTLLLEIPSLSYPKKLKLKIRKSEKDFDNQNMIAYSAYSTIQVLLRVHTFEQTMKNKIAALLNRDEIKDAFDIEFLLRKGMKLPELTESERNSLRKQIEKFTENDFKVKLGSIIDNETRSYYIQNRFKFLEGFLYK